MANKRISMTDLLTGLSLTSMVSVKGILWDYPKGVFLSCLGALRRHMLSFDNQQCL